MNQVYVIVYTRFPHTFHSYAIFRICALFLTYKLVFTHTLFWAQTSLLRQIHYKTLFHNNYAQCQFFTCGATYLYKVKFLSWCPTCRHTYILLLGLQTTVVGNQCCAGMAASVQTFICNEKWGCCATIVLPHSAVYNPAISCCRNATKSRQGVEPIVILQNVPTAVVYHMASHTL